MVASINLSTLSLATFNQKYRFAFTDNTINAPIETSVYLPTTQDASRYHSLTLDQFNKDLTDLESQTNKSSVMLSIKDQPKEITELLAKVAGGKYGNFVQKNLDKVVLGRNFQKLDSTGNFIEDLGATAGKVISQAIQPGSSDKLGFIDTYNSAFNSVTTKTAGDKVFTRFSQVVSVFMNEIKESYYQSKGQMKEDAGAYSYIKDALTATKDFMDKGGNLSFVKASEKTIFSSALQLMSDNVDTYLKTLGATGPLSIKFTGIA